LGTSSPCAVGTIEASPASAKTGPVVMPLMVSDGPMTAKASLSASLRATSAAT